MELISTLALLVAACLMVGLAVYDARHFRIRNQAVLAMLALYLVGQGVLLFPDLRNDLLAGGLLFGLGLLMWFLRGLGAGDAKLMLPLGLLMSFQGLMPFAVLLMGASVLFYLAILVCRAFRAERGLGGWFARMKTEGRVPYAVPLALASVPVLVAKAFLAS